MYTPNHKELLDATCLHLEEVRLKLVLQKTTMLRSGVPTIFYFFCVRVNDTVDEHAFVLEYVYLANYFFVIEAILIVPILFGNSLILFSIARFRRLQQK
jgi:hypothetical protein